MVTRSETPAPATNLPRPDAVAVAIETLVRRAVRDEIDVLRAELAARLAPAQPATLTVKQVAGRCGMGEQAIRRALAQHPDLCIRVGTKLLVRWPPFERWLLGQQVIDSGRRPARKKSA